ncbi:MAG: DUF721 domain-containing protein, partial [Candidatus Xenobia bacterium]
MQPASFYANALMAKYRKTPEFQAGMAALAWDGVVGPEIARHVHLSRIVDGVAWVRTSSSAWAHQMLFHKADILSRLQAVLGVKRILDIRIARGHLRNQADMEPEVQAAPEVPLADSDVAGIDGCVEVVADPALRDALRRAMTTVTKLQKGRQQQGWLSCQECGQLTPPGRPGGSTGVNPEMGAMDGAVPPSSLAQLRPLTPPGRPGGSTGVNPEMGAMDGAVPPSSLAQLRQFTDDKERL